MGPLPAPMKEITPSMLSRRVGVRNVEFFAISQCACGDSDCYLKPQTVGYYRSLNNFIHPVNMYIVLLGCY